MPDPQFDRGDCNSDSQKNIADAVFLLGFLFPSGPANVLGCADACDANDDGSVNLADAISFLGSIFGANPTPLPGPATGCGNDPTADAVGCDLPVCP